MDNQKQRICITGVTGFIGTHLKEYINQHSDQFEILPWTEEDPLNISECDIIIHCAARVHQMKDDAKDPLAEFRKVNVDLAVNTAELALKMKIKTFVFLSTVKVFGENPGSYDLNSPVNPQDPYALSKVEAEEKLSGMFGNQTESQCHCIILRLPMVYGPGNKGNMLQLLKMASKKISLPFNTATSKRSMIFVKNICDAVLTILTGPSKNKQHVLKYIISDDNDLSSGELYQNIYESFGNHGTGLFYIPESILRLGAVFGTLIEKCLPISLPINNNVIHRIFSEYCFSPQQFMDDWQWQPPYSPKQGIPETIEWYKREFVTTNIKSVKIR